MQRFSLRDHTQLLTVAGSRAYGMQSAASDVDLKGVAIPPMEYVLGYRSTFEQADSVEEMAVFLDDLTQAEQAVAKTTKLEGSVFALRKFVRLAADCNPHVLDVVFCRDEEVRLQSPIGEELRAIRQSFLSKRARYSFGGYATSQLKRIQTHRRWLLEPPTSAPTREAFGLPPVPQISKDKLAAAQAAIRKKLENWEPDFSAVDASTAIRLKQHWNQTLAELHLANDDQYSAAARTVGLNEDLVGLLTRERAYKGARAHYKQFCTWKKKRNPERAALEAQHGYDTKHAAHLVRLLTMALEIVQTQKVHVWRGDRDADTLLAIRAGAWSYDALLEWTERTSTAIDDAMQTTDLPEQPDRDALDAAVVRWMQQVLSQ